MSDMLASDVERWIALGNRVPDREPAHKKMRTSGMSSTEANSMLIDRMLREPLRPMRPSKNTIPRLLCASRDAKKIVEETE